MIGMAQAELNRADLRNLDEVMDSVEAEANFGAMVDDLCVDAITEKPSDFYSWTSLISQVEKLFSDDEDKICSIYDSFLSEFPLCYKYWRKYAAHRIRLCTFDKIIEVFERAVQAVTYSVDLWLDYCVFCMSLFPDPNDVRRQFKRGLSYVGRDYLCHILWDKCIEFEFSQQNWSALAYIYIQTLKHPKKMLHEYYDRFIQLVDMFKQEMECQGTFVAETDLVVADESPAVHMDDEVLGIIKDLLDESDNLSKSKAWQKYKLIGESLHRESCLLDEKVHCFEIQFRRTYFHVKPLDGIELENWHQYLDFVEEQDDFDWAVKLYERCLIPCALYTDFWIRYTQFLENKGGRELANVALERATKTFLKAVPSIHLFNARYKEQIRDFDGARAAFPICYQEELDSKFISHVIEQANMERRLGDNEAACRVYKEAIELATERRKLDILSSLYIHYSRVTYKATSNVAATLGILTDGIKQIPCSKLLLEELIKIGMMHGGSKEWNAVDSIVANALTSNESQSLSPKEKESISLFFLEFVDLCGKVDDLMKAWTRHVKLFPQSVRIAFDEEPPCGGKSAEVAASKAKDLCLDVDPSTCIPSHLDKPDQPHSLNQTEPREHHMSEDYEDSHDRPGNGSAPNTNSLAGATVDLSLWSIDNIDPIGDAKESVKPSAIQCEGDHGMKDDFSSLHHGGMDTSNMDKISPNSTDCRDLEDIDVLSKRTTENSFLVERNPSVSAETHAGASSDCSQGVKRLVQRSLSPAGTPRSVSSYVSKSSGDPPFSENSTQNIQLNPQIGRDWHLRRRHERFIKDPHSRQRPIRQTQIRSETDHIITIQRNASQPAEDKQTRYQQQLRSTQFNPQMGPHSWPIQNVQNIASSSQPQLAVQPVDQASAQMMPQAANTYGEMQQQQAYGQMMQYYYYQQQQVLLQQQLVPQQWQQAPDQWQQQQQQQQYWLQLQYQQQLPQAQTQQLTQAPLQQQQLAQVPMQMQQQAQMPMQMQQQAQMSMQQQQAQILMQQQAQQEHQLQQPQPENQAPLLHQQQLQQLLELQQLRKQQQQQQEPEQDNQSSQKERGKIQQTPTSSWPDLST